MKPCLYALLVVVLGMSALPARAYLKVETVPLPEGTPPEIGGLAFDPDGKLYVATRRNDIFVANSRRTRMPLIGSSLPAASTTASAWKLPLPATYRRHPDG